MEGKALFIMKRKRETEKVGKKALKLPISIKRKPHAQQAFHIPVL